MWPHRRTCGDNRRPAVESPSEPLPEASSGGHAPRRHRSRARRCHHQSDRRRWPVRRGRVGASSYGEGPGELGRGQASRRREGDAGRRSDDFSDCAGRPAVIVYLDTSSLAKLYIDETGTSDVRVLVEKARVVVTSDVAYPEMRAALARRQRDRTLSRSRFLAAKRAFDSDWSSYLAVATTPALCREAGRLAETYR